ncbi:MAG: HD domain-containing protein [Burkholderiaceae bacterium]|nr:HD domain-containing protein [Burkholderiaceae bacterium]
MPIENMKPGMFGDSGQTLYHRPPAAPPVPHEKENSMDLDAAAIAEAPTGLVVVASAEVLARVRDVLAAEYRLQVAANQAQAMDMAVAVTPAELVVMDLDAQSFTALAQQTAAIQDVTILAMAALAETRDSDTGNHLRRTQHYVRALARKLSVHPRFSPVLTPKNIGMIFKSVPLHDIGKVGLPDRVLLKPGKLTEEEFEIMKTHTTLGRDAIAQAEQAVGVELDFFTFAKEIAYSHQEKWDGTGYPLGLAGEQIPVSARLMAVADVYDALISRRVYKAALSHEDAVAIIAQTRGRHFDPDVVDAFLALQDTFHAIAIAFSDTDADLDKKAAYLQTAQIQG